MAAAPHQIHFPCRAGLAAILFSAPLAWIASWAWSEALFILLVTLSLYYSDRFLTSGERAQLIWAAAFTALACLTRYVGVVLLLAVVPLLVLQRGPALLQKVRRAGLFLVIGAAPLAIWMLRNLLVTGTLTGPRKSDLSLAYGIEYVARTLNTIEGWIPLMVDLRTATLRLDPWTGKIVGAILIGAILIALAALTAWSILQWRRGLHIATLPSVTGAFAFLYLPIVTVAPLTVAGLQGDEIRYIVPAYIPLVLMVVFAADALLSNRAKLHLPARLASAPLIRTFVEGGMGTRALAAALIVPLALSVSYAGCLSIRDTYTSIFQPEYGWNAVAYNAKHIGIGTESVSGRLKELVGDTRPAVRAYFDLYLIDGALIYHRRTCSPEDMDKKVFLHVHPVHPFVLPAVSKHTGYHNLDFFPDRQGAMLNNECLAIAPLPEYRIKRIDTGQHDFRTTFWETHLDPSPQ